MAKNDLSSLDIFQSEIECLSQLDKWINQFNLFDVLGIVRAEIRHSNMLAWLLDPKGNHGLGDRVLKGFIHWASSCMNEKDALEISKLDLCDTVVLREWHNIDIFCLSQKARAVLCIENKIDSKEHDGQLPRYYEDIDNLYPGRQYGKIYIFLSPYGEKPSDKRWYPMGYQSVLDIVEEATKNIDLSAGVQLMIENYTAIIRRDIVGDEELARVCAEIYANHQKALDLIFRYKPDRTAMLAEIFRIWCDQKAAEGEICFDPKTCVKTNTRFLTARMTEILPDAEEANSGWNTKNHYFYEIEPKMDGSGFNVHLALSLKNLPEELAAKCSLLYAFCEKQPKRKKGEWLTLKNFGSCRIDAEEEIRDQKEDIFTQLDNRLRTIKSFEMELLAWISEASSSESAPDAF